MSYTTFNENDRKNINQWLRSHNISKNCMLCAEGEYEVRDGIMTPQYMDFDSGLLSDEGFPMISLECNTCSHLRFFSLYKILPYFVD